MALRNQIIIAVTILVMFLLGTAYYRNISTEHYPGENAYRLGSKLIEDGKPEEALVKLRKSLAEKADSAETHQSMAVALMQLKRFEASMESFDRAIEIDPAFAEAYANRGVLRDRMGNYPEAVKDYRKAIELKPELAKGPGWLWRFLHNVADKPSTLAQRVTYIESELKKPESERLLRVPELDARQQMYKP